MHETTTSLLITLPDIHRLKKISSDRLSNKPFTIWLFTTPPLKYAATLHGNLSLIACFPWPSHRGLGDASLNCPKDRFWDSSKSDEKLVRGGGTTLCLLIIYFNRETNDVLTNMYRYSATGDINGH